METYNNTPEELMKMELLGHQQHSLDQEQPETTTKPCARALDFTKIQESLLFG